MRENLKKSIFWKYLLLMGLVGIFGGAISFCFRGDLANGFIASMFVSWFLSMSYILSVRYVWDKTAWFYGLVLGCIPVRMGIGLGSSAVILSIPQINQGAYVFGFMFYWVVFTSMEFGIALEFWHKVKWEHVV